MFSVLQVLAVILVAVAMALSLAHALELPGKMRLDRETYYAMQPIYYPGFTIGGGVGEVGGTISTIVLLSLTPLGSTEFWLTLVALIGLFSVQAVYWFFTHPVNKFWVEGENLDRFGSGFFAFGSNRSRLGNETHPTDWTRLRDRWEYSHLGRAGLALVSLISLVHRHLGEWLESNRRRLSQDAHPTSGRFAEVPTCSVREECCRAWPGRCCRGWRRSTTRGGSCRSGWQESDAEASLRLLGRLDHETQFMMYEPEERTTTVEAQGESLRDILITGNSTVLLAK